MLRTKSLLILILALFLALATTSRAVIANFDDLAEGGLIPVLSDNGVTFSDLDGGSPGFNLFAVDASSGVFDGADGYSAPNILTFNSYAPGQEVSFGRMKSFDFGTGAPASSASFNVLSLSNDPDSTLTLQGLRNGVVVNSVTLALTEDFYGVQSLTLGDGLYDSFHVVVAAPGDVVLVALDNVTVNPVPEPASGAFLGLGALGLVWSRLRRPSPSRS